MATNLQDQDDDGEDRDQDENECENIESTAEAEPNRAGWTGYRHRSLEGVSCDWETIRQHRARIRAMCKAMSNALPDKRIPSAKMLNRRTRHLTELIEMLDDMERDCPKVDWTRANELVSIYADRS